MFEQTFVPEGRTRKPWTVVAAFLVQLVAVGIILAIPLIFARTLPIPGLTSMLLAPPPVVRIDRPTSARFESRFAAASCSDGKQLLDAILFTFGSGCAGQGHCQIAPRAAVR